MRRVLGTTAILLGLLPVAAWGQVAEPLDAALVVGVRGALNDLDVRMNLISQMRESSLPNRALSMEDWFERSGLFREMLSVSLQGGVDGPPPAFAGRQVSLPFPQDRATWSGTNDVVLLSVDTAFRDAGEFLTGYDAELQPVMIPLGAALHFPLLVIEPVAADAPGPNPGLEPVLTQEIPHTVSTPEEEFPLPEICGDRTRPCGTPTLGARPFQNPDVTPDNCFAPPGGLAPDDWDEDGLSDECEIELARYFAPHLQTDSADRAPITVPFWAAQPGTGPGEFVRLFYALSYYGDAGSQLLELIEGARWHLGDSEFVVVGLGYGQGAWRVGYAVLSAHFGHGNRTRAFRPSDLQYSAGRPVVFAAQDKHANFVSINECNRRLGSDFGVDRCNGADRNSLPVAVDPHRNLGSEHQPLVDCEPDPNGIFAGVECFWSADRFWGWTSPDVRLSLCRNEFSCSAAGYGSEGGPLQVFRFKAIR